MYAARIIHAPQSKFSRAHRRRRPAGRYCTRKKKDIAPEAPPIKAGQPVSRTAKGLVVALLLSRSPFRFFRFPKAEEGARVPRRRTTVRCGGATPCSQRLTRMVPRQRPQASRRAARPRRPSWRRRPPARGPPGSSTASTTSATVRTTKHPTRFALLALG